jgi:hypothetical protein
MEPQHPRAVPPADDCGILDCGSGLASRSLCAVSPPARCVRTRRPQVGRSGVYRSAREGPRDIICPGGRWVVRGRARGGALPNSRWVLSA